MKEPIRIGLIGDTWRHETTTHLTWWQSPRARKSAFTDVIRHKG